MKRCFLNKRFWYIVIFLVSIFIVSFNRICRFYNNNIISKYLLLWTSSKLKLKWYIGLIDYCGLWFSVLLIFTWKGHVLYNFLPIFGTYCWNLIENFNLKSTCTIIPVYFSFVCQIFEETSWQSNWNILLEIYLLIKNTRVIKHSKIKNNTL